MATIKLRITNKGAKHGLTGTKICISIQESVTGKLTPGEAIWLLNDLIIEADAAKNKIRNLSND